MGPEVTSIDCPGCLSTDTGKRGHLSVHLPTLCVSWQRMVKNLEKELALLKQELAVHNSLVGGEGRATAGTELGTPALS